ncbi:hypothetical protein [uncultured Veillonella sp.]|uniref:hypothetical protein n=1 Tax=uncultured Veillonella sp. TaxID=159268 RepID=UPI0025D0A8A2|nr:hypothetical protein [uncultured Veillonella sp.]
MKRLLRLLVVFLIPAFLLVSYNSVDASWLSKTLDKLGTSSTSSRSYDAGSSVSKKGERWIEVYSNQNYTTYVDRRSITSSGVAQDRIVKAHIMRKYTPVGSQWLGINSREVKPDTITYSVSTEAASFKSNVLMYQYFHYYDVHGNLIYRGSLKDIQGKTNAFFPIEPMSEEEQIKDALFSMVGWDY